MTRMFEEQELKKVSAGLIYKIRHLLEHNIKVLHYLHQNAFAIA